MPNLVNLIQKISTQAVEESMPSAILFGTVTSESPIEIRVDQRFTLDAAHLILTNNVKNHEVEMRVEDGAIQTYTILNRLKVGEKVILIRQQGGQKYIVLDKVVNT